MGIALLSASMQNNPNEDGYKSSEKIVPVHNTVGLATQTLQIRYSIKT